jgi:Flp pilus assembly pilin Flp
MRRLTRLARDRDGASAAEFALVVPLLVLFLLGIIDVGRLLWTVNQAEKATQAGVRAAVVTDIIATDLTDDFTEEYDLVGGDPVPDCTSGTPPACFDSTTCDVDGCDPDWGHDPDAFTYVVDRVRYMYPVVTSANVEIQYDNIGLGFAGDPSGPDVAALVTVRLRGLTFQPLVLFGGSVNLPSFSAALTLEDGSGVVSN